MDTRVNERETLWSDLMRSANAGDTGAYARLLKELLPALRAAARRGLARAGSADTDAEDIVQETLLAIHLKRHTWRSEEPIAPWIWAIARNKLTDVLRRRGRRVELPIEDFAEVLPSEETRPAAPAHDVERHLKTLPDGQRAVVQAVAVEGVSIAEAAARLDMSNGAVRVALHRGLATLAATLRTTRS